MSARRVVLCADDFAQTPPTVEGIVALVAASRLSAVGCLVESPLWAAAAPRLAAAAGDRCDVGLHCNLTQDVAGGVHRATALPLTILAAYLRLLGRPRIEAALQRQLDLFENACRRAPDFVDGHQHVHQLPVVRDALVAVLASRYPAGSVAVRATVAASHRGVKAATIARLGGRGLERALRAAGIPHNTDFAGVYDLSPSADFPALFRAWLAGARDGALVMCHPASPEAAARASDPIAAARARELAYLASAEFPPDVERSGVRLVRFRELV